MSLNKNCYNSFIQETHKKLHTKYHENKMKLMSVYAMSTKSKWNMGFSAICNNLEQKWSGQCFNE